MDSLLEHLKPSDREIRELALREVDRREAHRFEPIQRGPLFALLGLALVGLLALPSCLLRLLRGVLAGRGREGGDSAGQRLRHRGEGAG